MSLVDLFKRPSDDDDGDLPQPLSDRELLAWSAELATVLGRDDVMVGPAPRPRRQAPLKATIVAAERPKRTRPLVAAPV